MRAEAVRLLKELAEDPNIGVAEAAGLALAELHEPAAVPVLAYRLRTGLGRLDFQWSYTIPLPSIVKALEKLTGENFRSAKVADLWDMIKPVVG